LLSSDARRRIEAHFFEGRLLSTPNVETHMLPVLEAIADGTEHRLRNVTQRMATSYSSTSSVPRNCRVTIARPIRATGFQMQVRVSKQVDYHRFPGIVNAFHSGNHELDHTAVSRLEAS
jgi:hypothetical protein